MIFAPNTREAYITRRSRISLPQAISLAVGEYHCEAISPAAGGYLVICFAALSVIFLLRKSDIAAAPQ